MFRELIPNPVLAESIKSFWMITRTFPKEKPFFEVLPDGYAELIFYFGTDFFLRKEKELVKLGNPFLVGLLEDPIYLHAVGTFTIIGVRFYPWAVFSILGKKPDNETHEFDLAYFSSISEELERLIVPGQEQQALNCINQFFLSRQPLQKKHNPDLIAAGNELQKANGDITIHSLVNRLNIPVRTLQRLFMHATGQSAKSVARKIRFERVRDRIWNNPDIQLTQLAYEFGFSDQAHFNREFRYFSHKTPGEFAQEASISRQYLQTNLSYLFK